VTIRGNHGRTAFRCADDATVFLALLACAFTSLGIRCAGYCLMSTHYHLLVASGSERLPAAMHRVNGGYAHAHNRRYGREHVWGRRYAAIAIEDEAHFLNAHRYIELNPVTAGLCKRPAHWRWSSYRAIAGLVQAPEFPDVSMLLACFHRDRAVAIVRLREFVEAEEPAAQEPTA
jgi:putative transposase